MQGQLRSAGSAPAATTPSRYGAMSTDWTELWRGGWVIFVKHMRKFASNSMEIGGTLGWPILWVVMFGLGMERVVDTANLGSTGSYLAFITPGIIALTALSGAVNAGMVLLEEKTKGVLKEYFVAPIPRMSILLASTGSGLVKTLIQAAISLLLAGAPGARSPGGGRGAPRGAVFLLLYVMAFVGFSNGMAARSKSVGGYHMLLFVLNLPLLFLSNALYPLSTMPVWMRAFAYANPTTYAVDGIRHTLYRSGELPVWLSLLVLVAFVALCSWFGLRSFKKLLEGN